MEIERSFGEPETDHLKAVRDLYGAARAAVGVDVPLDALQPLLVRAHPAAREGLCDVLETGETNGVLRDASLVLRVYLAALYGGSPTIGRIRDGLGSIAEGLGVLSGGLLARAKPINEFKHGEDLDARLVAIRLTTALAERHLAKRTGSGWSLTGARVMVRKAAVAQAFEAWWPPEGGRRSSFSECLDRLTDSEGWPVDRNALAEAVAHAEAMMAFGETATPWLLQMAEAAAEAFDRTDKARRGSRKAVQSSIFPPAGLVLAWGCLELVHAWAPDKVGWPAIRYDSKCAASRVAGILHSAEMPSEPDRDFRGPLKEAARAFVANVDDIFMPRTWVRVDPERLAGLSLPPIADEDCPEDFPDGEEEADELTDNDGEVPSEDTPPDVASATLPSGEG